MEWVEEALKKMSPFQARVLREVMRIPKGEVRSYREIAVSVGSPRAVRAVGTALRRNPLPGVIPCHRVICSDGRLGRYSAEGGVERKRELLTQEGWKGCDDTP